jgi:hypothetical protein
VDAIPLKYQMAFSAAIVSSRGRPRGTCTPTKSWTLTDLPNKIIFISFIILFFSAVEEESQIQ